MLARPVAMMTASRLAVIGALYGASRVRDEDVRDLFRMWDGIWYETIAQHGYPTRVYGFGGKPNGLFAFFPVYPLLVRGVHAVTPFGWSDAASIVSFALAVGVALFLWLLVRDWKGDAVADRTAALFAFFPGAYVLTIHYSDGALLCAATACLWLVTRRQWLLAGAVGAICTAARPNGIVIVACCA